MRRVLIAALIVAGLFPSPSKAQTLNCGSFKYGLDGAEPGPSVIRATNVSCGIARSVALYGPRRGSHWKFHQGRGLIGVYTRHNQRITYYGE